VEGTRDMVLGGLAAAEACVKMTMMMLQ